MAPNISALPAPIQGLCYQPAPFDFQSQTPAGKYFDSDFFNDDFPGFWSASAGGRGDLANMADLGINFIHLYNWNAPPLRNHLSFLTECAAQGIAIAVPFNNAFCQNTENGSWGENAIYSVLSEIYGSNTTPDSAVVMWTISNEYNQGGPTAPTPAQIAQVAQVILYFESQIGATAVLPISCPTSFAGNPNGDGVGIWPTQQLQTAFSSTSSFTAAINGSSVTIPAPPSTFFADRYVVATNPQNPGSIPPASSGLTIASYLSTFQTSFPDNPLWFSEIGIGLGNCTTGWPSTAVQGAAQQALFTANQLESADPSSYSFLVGSSVFEYTPDYFNWGLEPLKPYTFALLSDLIGTAPFIAFPLDASSPTNGSGGTVGSGATYPVQCLFTANPVYQSVRNLWNPNASSASPASFCLAPPQS